MKKNLYLHIGTHKTGSTTIQHFLKDNVSELKSIGYYYPMEGAYYYPLEASASLLAHGILNRRPEYLGNTEINTEKCINDIKNDINQSNAQNVIVSSEHFSNATNEEDVRKIFNLFEPLFENITVIVYLRRQDLRLESSYSQRVKMGSVISSFSDYLNKSTGWNYYNMLKPWIDVFGSEKVVIRPFEISEFYKNDLIQDFLNIIDCEIPYVKPTIKNQSPPVEYIEFQRLILESLPSYNERIKFLSLLMSLPVRVNSTKYTYMNPEMRRKFLDIHRESNHLVATKYLGKSDGILFHENEISSLPVYNGMTIKRLAEITRQYIALSANSNKKLQALKDENLMVKNTKG